MKTNVDGTKPERVSVYVAARDRIESFKFHPLERTERMTREQWQAFMKAQF